MPKSVWPPRLVVVEIFDDSTQDATEVAKEIVGNLENVRQAYPAYDDGFGRIVRAGEIIES